MSSKAKTIRNTIITILILVLGFYLLQALFVPKYVSDVVEGNLIREYYEEEDKNFDVVFVGDCEVYENFSPVELWKDYGINSYIRGSAEQYIFQSYYLLEDTLRYHTPKVVVFNIQSLQFEKAQNEAYNRMTLDDMEWSMAKVNSIKASMTEDEKFIDYVFPLFRYHSRWSELKSEDFEYMFKRNSISHNGYYMRVDAKAAENVPKGRMLGDYSFSDRAWSYLDKMRELCAEKGIQLVMIKAPSLYPYWYPEWDEQLVEYSKKYDIPYYNLIDKADEIGLDYRVDTYDSGLHLNLTGAEKLSKYFGEILSKEYKVPDRRDDKSLAAIWDKNILAYEAEIMEQCKKYSVDPKNLGR